MVRAAPAWHAGPIEHVLPQVNHDTILVKLSLDAPLRDGPPVLMIDRRSVAGRMTDSAGRFWTFHASGLTPERTYTLALVDKAGHAVADAWPLRTFPAPDSVPQRLRLLMFTCAGGHDVVQRYLPMATRIKLLERALSFEPDAMVANGDHVYWDLKTRAARELGASPRALAYAGAFDRTAPIIGTHNEAVLLRAVGPQIVPLYGARCRSVPVFFLQDDHDNFDNDEADDHYVSLPPDAFMLNAARASQALYYPEFLPDATRPLGLPSSDAPDRAPRVSESFGSLRYGRLLELLMYDCRRHMTLKGATAGFVPPEVEDWLKARMAAPEIAHVINAPSTPVGWSAGKWGEWYADVEQDGHLTTARAKPYWQPGWRTQHDRLLQAASAMAGRLPLFISGDLHVISEGRITRTNDIDLSANPVRTIITGPLGTGDSGWPSAFRGMTGRPPAGIQNQELQAPIEQHGFIIADVEPGRIGIRFFKWDVKTQPVEAIADLQPFRESEHVRST
jgi:phosphodiesterase/alkaline phosphatase D-like protein